MSNAHDTSWIGRDGTTIYIPAVDFSKSGLSEERSQYDITVKLFFLPSANISERCVHTQEAIDLVLNELHVPSIDLLIVSFPGVSFDADDDDDDEDEGTENDQEQERIHLNEMIKTWKTLEHLHSQSVVAQIGLAQIRPSVDQINVRDCCVVPKSLILYAKQEKIELLTHNDCTNILPKGTIRELLGCGPHGIHLLLDTENNPEGLCGEVEPQWVVKYTAVVRDRGVIENKGYFAMAEIIK